MRHTTPDQPPKVDRERARARVAEAKRTAQRLLDERRQQLRADHEPADDDGARLAETRRRPVRGALPAALTPTTAQAP